MKISRKRVGLWALVLAGSYLAVKMMAQEEAAARSKEIVETTEKGGQAAEEAASAQRTVAQQEALAQAQKAYTELRAQEIEVRNSGDELTADKAQALSQARNDYLNTLAQDPNFSFITQQPKSVDEAEDIQGKYDTAISESGIGSPLHDALVAKKQEFLDTYGKLTDADYQNSLGSDELSDFEKWNKEQKDTQDVTELEENTYKERVLEFRAAKKTESSASEKAPLPEGKQPSLMERFTQWRKKIADQWKNSTLDILTSSAKKNLAAYQKTLSDLRPLEPLRDAYEKAVAMRKGPERHEKLSKALKNIEKLGFVDLNGNADPQLFKNEINKLQARAKRLHEQSDSVKYVTTKRLCDDYNRFLWVQKMVSPANPRAQEILKQNGFDSVEQLNAAIAKIEPAVMYKRYATADENLDVLYELRKRVFSNEGAKNIKRAAGRGGQNLAAFHGQDIEALQEIGRLYGMDGGFVRMTVGDVTLNAKQISDKFNELYNKVLDDKKGASAGRKEWREKMLAPYKDEIQEQAKQLATNLGQEIEKGELSPELINGITQDARRIVADKTQPEDIRNNAEKLLRLIDSTRQSGSAFRSGSYVDALNKIDGTDITNVLTTNTERGATGKTAAQKARREGLKKAGKWTLAYLVGPIGLGIALAHEIGQYTVDEYLKGKPSSGTSGWETMASTVQGVQAQPVQGGYYQAAPAPMYVAQPVQAPVYTAQPVRR